MIDRMKKIYLLCLLGLMSVMLACNVDINTGSTPEEEPTATPEPTSMPSDTAESSPAPAGWLTYHSDEFCFDISYPPNFQALDDADSLYGWTNGVVLLYNGGQSYDIAIQAWDNQADLDANYPNAGSSIVTHNTCNGKILSINNVTQDPENASVIATFTLLP